MWKKAHQIISIGWQIGSFYQINWEIIDTMFPHTQSSHPLHATKQKNVFITVDDQNGVVAQRVAD